MDKTHLKYSMLFTLLLLSHNALAGVFKCVNEAGNTTYQSSPCTATETQADVRLIDSGGTNDTNKITSSAIRLGEREMLMEAELNDASRRRNVLPGMSKQQVKRAKGRPDKINHGQYGQSHNEQWIYHEKNRKTTYIYFDNDIVTSKQWETD